MSRIAAIAIALIILLIVSLVWAVNHYRDNAIAYKDQRDQVSSVLTLANDTITDMKVRQRDAAVLDTKYTKDLADAKKQLDDLQRCVSSGKCGLHVNAKCPANGTTSTSGVGDASSPELTGAAERDYWRLRARIETITGQVNYLQDYIKNQCSR